MLNLPPGVTLTKFPSVKKQFQYDLHAVHWRRWRWSSRSGIAGKRQMSTIIGQLDITSDGEQPQAKRSINGNRLRGSFLTADLRGGGSTEGLGLQSDPRNHRSPRTLGPLTTKSGPFIGSWLPSIPPAPSYV
jgi:hypothetical protein